MKQSLKPKRSPLQWLLSLPLNLRGKLVAGNMLVTLLAILGMGYYVYYRAQETNRFLSARLEQSVRQSSESALNAGIREQADRLDGFFSARSKDVSLIGLALERLLQREPDLSGGVYWEASRSLFRSPTGSWDNNNSELASVFLPAERELTDALRAELNTLKYAEATLPAVLQNNPEVIAIYFGGLAGETLYFPNIDLANIVPRDFDVTRRPWFVQAAPPQNPQRQVTWSDPYQDAALHGLVVTSSIPVYGADNEFRGVAAMDIQLNVISEIVSGIQAGQSGYAFLLDQHSRLIALPPAGYADFKTTPQALPLGERADQASLPDLPERFFEILAKASAGQSGLETVMIEGSERFVAYQPLPAVGYSLVILVPSGELLAEARAASAQIAVEMRNTVTASMLLVGIILLAASAAALAMGSALTSPLKKLTKTAEDLAAGDLAARAVVASRDEIGTLAKTLNIMAVSLSNSIRSLEERVAERTTDLEGARLQSEKRVAELQAIGEISGIIAGEQRIETLLPLITRLVSERFAFYHVGIFLLDETGQYAVLQAANSEGGQKMLARRHMLEVGATGIVGYVAEKGEARIALDVGTDAIFFNNPDLPLTRSEMALPLIARGQIIGVLDVQSEQAGAFTDTDARTLSILGDQIAIAIENARLLDQTQRALGEMQTLYSQHVLENWRTFTEEEAAIGYQQSLTGGSRLKAAVDSDEIRAAMNQGSLLVIPGSADQGEPQMVVPVKLRGQVIGVIKIQAPTTERHWSQDEIHLAEAVSDRLSLALENARLIQDSQRQVLKEQAISEVTARIGSSVNLRNVLQTAVEELGRFLPGSEVLLQFETEPQNGHDGAERSEKGQEPDHA